MSAVVACSVESVEEARGHICRAGRENVLVLVVRIRFDLGVVEVIAKGRGAIIAEDILMWKIDLELKWHCFEN